MSAGRCAVLCACVLVGGCDLLGTTVALELHLPALPQAWVAAFGQPGYVARWRDPAGRARETRGETWAEGPCGVVVTLGAGVYTPVVVTPGPEMSGATLLPAGAIAPLDAADGESLGVTFEHGAAALLLDRVADRGAALVPGGLDVEEIVRGIETAGRGDPWVVDTETLLRSLATGDPVIQRLPTVCVAAVVLLGASGPDACSLVWDDALAQPVAAGGACPPIPWGFHRLHVCDTSGRWVGTVLDLWVGERSAAWLLRSGAPPATTRP